MLPNLFTIELQTFIRDNEHVDVKDLLLKQKTILGIPTAWVVQQIVGRKKAKEKLPSFYHTNAVIYPPGINLEQSSSEDTARFKKDYAFADIPSPDRIADITGGLGIDSYFFERKFNEVLYVEPDTELLQISRHNHQQLGAHRIKHFAMTAEKFLEANEQSLDCIYIDPSRRNDNNRKVFSFADCTPNISTLLPQLFQKARHLVIKASPLLDIQKGIGDLEFVKRVFVLAVHNECKELLFICERGHADEPVIQAVNIDKNKSLQSLDFLQTGERKQDIEFSDPQTYLYEPNVSLLKAGAFKTLSSRFNIPKLHPSTHLYTSDRLEELFPGNIFRILALAKSSPKELREHFPEGKANLITRNYPLSVKALRQKTSLGDGGDRYLIGCSGRNKKYLIVAEKIVSEKS